MTFRSLRIAALPAAAAFGTALLAAPVAAQSTDAPLKLQSFMKKPIASGTATRAVKQRDGSYRQVSLVRRPKPAAPASIASPAVMTPDAAEAFASHAASLVRVVSPGELNEIDLAADAKPVSTTAIEVVATPAIQTVQAGEFNAIDQTAADATRAVSLDELNRTFAAPVVSEPDKTDESASWLQRMLIMVGGAFAAASAAVRFLVG
jgi:hypothetical protein